MLPNRPEWNSWNPLEKSAYIAQIAAALSLLPTVVFSFLSWREARNARFEQMEYFVSEKAPDIEISSIKIIDTSDDKNGLFTITLRNTGGSSAKISSISIYKVGETTPFIDTSKDKDNIWRKVSISKGRDFSVPFLRVNTIQDQFGWPPESARIFRLGDKLENGEEVAAMIAISFIGDFRDEHGLLESIAMKKRAPEPASSKSMEISQ